MLTRINFFGIIKSHFKSLRSLNQKSDSIYWGDFLLFIVVPVIISAGLTVYGVAIKNELNSLIAAISILGGFLFNLLAIIYSLLDKIKLDVDSESDQFKNMIKLRFVKEIHSNISFNILIAIFSTIFLVIYSFDYSKVFLGCLIESTLLFINYFLLFIFVLTLLMVLNRIYIILDKQIKK